MSSADITGQFATHKNPRDVPSPHGIIIISMHSSLLNISTTWIVIHHDIPHKLFKEASVSCIIAFKTLYSSTKGPYISYHETINQLGSIWGVLLCCFA
jgi:hypothetical protein